MSFEERFSKDEQLLLNTLPTLVGSAMTFAGGSGLGTVKEMMANSRALIEGSKLYADNEIISAIIPVMDTMKEGWENARIMRERSKEHMSTLQVKSTEELRSAALSDAQKANALLAEKATPQEAEQYNCLLYTSPSPRD